MKRDQIASLGATPPDQPGIRCLPSHFFSTNGAASPLQEFCLVVEERALFIDVAGLGLYTLMWTPADAATLAGFTPADGVLAEGMAEQAPPQALALCAGFLFTESMIDSMADVTSLALCPDAPDVVKVQLRDLSRVRGKRRAGVVASSCGVCGGVDQVGALQEGLSRVGDSLRMDAGAFGALMQRMHERQGVFRATGGTHAAALFSADAGLLASAEDLGRHNALDKAIGLCLLRGVPTTACAATLSGRVSLEMIVKAARAGIEIVAAVSAPSSLAITVADQLGITLCGFVRQGRLTAFTHAHRLTAGCCLVKRGPRKTRKGKDYI